MARLVTTRTATPDGDVVFARQDVTKVTAAQKVLDVTPLPISKVVDIGFTPADWSTDTNVNKAFNSLKMALDAKTYTDFEGQLQAVWQMLGEHPDVITVLSPQAIELFFESIKKFGKGQDTSMYTSTVDVGLSDDDADLVSMFGDLTDFGF